jgi:hypothetical protein
MDVVFHAGSGVDVVADATTDCAATTTVENDAAFERADRPWCEPRCVDLERCRWTVDATGREDVGHVGLRLCGSGWSVVRVSVGLRGFRCTWWRG